MSTVTVTPDGKGVISGSFDKTIKVWCLETAQELFSLSGHIDWVSSIAVTSDGKRLISASDESGQVASPSRSFHVAKLKAF